MLPTAFLPRHARWGTQSSTASSLRLTLSEAARHCPRVRVPTVAVPGVDLLH